MQNTVLKVLILEDNPYDAELNLKTLHNENWIIESRIASNEETFIAFLREFNPDVILSDYNLPVFNGMDALRISRIEKPVTPFIIVTGSLDEETAVDCIKQGAWDYVLKEHLIRLNPAIKNAIELGTVRKQREIAEVSFRESEEHYRALSENSPDIIMRFDKDCRHLFVNNAVNPQLGLKPELFINKTHREMGLFDTSMCDFWEEHILEVFKSKKTNEVEFSFQKEDGLIFFEWRLFPEFGPEGEVITVLAVARDISFKKQTEEALRKSEERLQMALEATSDGLWDYDLKTSRIYFSPRYETMLGYEAGSFKNDINVFNDLMHPEDRDRITAYIDEMMKTRSETVELVTRLRRSDGTYSWILARGKVYPYGENTDAVRIVGTNVDITSRKRQEEIQKTIFEIGNAVVTTRNLEELYVKIQEILGLIIDTKNCYIALYDKKTDKITLPFHRDEKDHFTEFPAGKTVTAYVIRTGRAQLLSSERIQELSDSGHIENIGTPSVSWLGVPLKIDRDIIGVFVVQSYDETIKYSEDDVKILEFVSDQIALAISRKKDEDYIRENEQKQRKIIESSPDGLLVTSNDGVITDHNTSILEMLRIKNMHSGERNFLEFVNPKDIEKVKLVFRNTLNSGYQKNIELLMNREDKSEFNAEISLGLIESSGNVVETFVIIIKDITDRINYELNLKIAKDRAEESDRLKTSFLSNMSHEIRTPLNAIVGFAELLSQTGIDDNDRREFISHINQGSDTLLNLIDDIIDISKIEAGQIRVKNSVFRLSSLLAELHALFTKNLKRMGTKALSFTIDNFGHDSNLNIIADPFRLRQIFINLLSNAFKFTEAGSIEFGIKEINTKFIYFYVKDTGIGIQKDKQHLIFDRFRQGHESKARFYGGTGLGLAISKHLAELMGGSISVNSEPGTGSEFIFSIEYADSNSEITSEKEPELLNSLDWSKKTILIAEDESSNFRLLKDILRKSKVRLLWAKDGEEVVSLFRENPEVDLILMDIRLPLLSGNEAAAAIKKIKGDVPIIAQTAYAMAEEKEKIVKGGCDDYISKPIIAKELIAKIAKYL